MNLNVIFKVKPLKGPRKPNVVEQSLSEYFAPEYVSVSLIWKKKQMFIWFKSDITDWGVARC